MDMDFLNTKSLEIKNLVIDAFESGRTGHIPSSYSCAEIMTALFYGDVLRFKPQEPAWEGRDRFVLSKGHAGIIYYSILADLGFFPKEELLHFASAGGMCSVHVDSHVPGVDVNTGSLACGFGVAVGMAHAAKIDMKNHLVFALLGDGECYEGSIWEGAMHAAFYKLNNLVTIIDHNHMCCTGFIEDRMGIEPLGEKWCSFGFDVKCINGHNFEEILSALDGIRCRKSAKPLCIIADTVKGKGIPSVENTPLCHGWMPKSNEDLAKARFELNNQEAF